MNIRSEETFEYFSYTSDIFTRKHHEEKVEACRQREKPLGGLTFPIDAKGGEIDRGMEMERNNT
jgi:hypothetical protein